MLTRCSVLNDQACTRGLPGWTESNRHSASFGGKIPNRWVTRLLFPADSFTVADPGTVRNLFQDQLTTSRSRISAIPLAVNEGM
jgi:hypothetical protein